MVVFLDLTEKTIDCFNECAKKGNYEKFVGENQKFIRTLSENLKRVKFPLEETIADMVSQNCKFYFHYLTKWNPNDPRGVVPETTLLERHTLNLVIDMKRALSIRNWDNFYSKYYPTADFMMKTARNQGVLDFKIQNGSGIFESFHERDFVVTNLQQSTNEEIWEHQNSLMETKNSKEMILKVVPNTESHQSGTSLHSYQSNNDGKAITCIENHRADTPKHGHVRETATPSEREHLGNRRTITPVIHTRCSDHSTNGLHGSKNSESYGCSDNSPGIPLRNIPISEQPPVDQLPKSSHQITSSTPYEKLPPLQYSSLHARYKDTSSSNAPQHVHDTPKTTRNCQTHRPAQESLKDVPKQNPQERYSTPSPSQYSRQAPFDTFGQDSQHTIIQAEYKPGFSAADALRSMEPGMTLNRTRESLSPAYNQEILNYQEDMKLATLIPRTTPPIHESLNNSSSSREMSLCRDSPMFDNLSFDMELEKQNLRNAEELKAKKEERKKKQKQFVEELKTLKEESKQRFQMLLKCIMLKRRFEEQEQHWMDWIAGCRRSIASFLNRWYDFYDDVEKSHRGFRRPEVVDLYELQRDTGHFLNSIMVTFNVMECDFEHMKRIGSAHPDTLFVKVLMKCIADIAHELLRIYNFTQHLGTDQSKFLELQSMMTRVNPNRILSTDQLRSICRTEYPSDYQYVTFPDLDRNLNFREL